MIDRDHDALANRVLELADDELILAHRNSEWCGHAPILEEDIAFANLSLDELGHAMLWYRLHAGLTGQDLETTPDRLVYFREPYEYRAAQFCALPKSDWAFSMLRQYLWDALEAVRLEAFAGCSFKPLAETAARIRVEEVYHLRHTSAWVKRLGLGTDESNARMQAALDLIWPYTGELTGGTEIAWETYGAPNDQQIREDWEDRVRTGLTEAGLVVPDLPLLTLDRSLQSGYIVDILAVLQQVARLDPEAEW
ncbi:MAG TPA: 1,2-phenylacetyl-CoA epoxidase subunit PaaC [Anaerolineales bacterium]|nr:1,2-phenylacetyl-CoA epoxidase subunit PaaC [Anaerolineales bacterium]